MGNHDMGSNGSNGTNSRLGASPRRGSTTVEYSLTLAVIVFGLTVVSTIGRDAVAPVFQELVGATHAAESVPTGVVAAKLNLQDTAANPYVFLVSVVVVIASICFVSNHLHRSKSPARESTPETETRLERQLDASERLRNKIFEKREELLSELSRDLSLLMHSRVDVSQLMSTRMKVVAADLAAKEVRQLMSKSKLHHLLVCDGPELLGVISDRDLGKTRAKKAGDLMTARPISVAPSTPLIPAVSTMINKRISCLPVTENGELKGVLTRTDLLLAFQCMLQIMTKLLHEEAADDG